MEKTEKTVEDLAEAYADSKERRLTSYWKGLKDGYIAGHDKVRNQTIDACKEILKNQTVDCSRVITVNDLLNEMEALKTNQT